MRLQLLMMLVPMMMTETTIRFRMLILTTHTIAYNTHLPLCDNHQSTDSSELSKLKKYVQSALAKGALRYT